MRERPVVSLIIFVYVTLSLLMSPISAHICTNLPEPETSFLQILSRQNKQPSEIYLRSTSIYQIVYFTSILLSSLKKRDAW